MGSGIRELVRFQKTLFLKRFQAASKESPASPVVTVRGKQSLIMQRLSAA